MHLAAIRNAGRLDAAENGIELRLRYAKAVMMYRKSWLIGSDEVQRKPIVDVDGGKRADGPCRPADAQYLGEAPGAGNLIARRDDQVIELDRHGKAIDRIYTIKQDSHD